MSCRDPVAEVLPSCETSLVQIQPEKHASQTRFEALRFLLVS
jgi:hypothetical protein